MRLSANHEEARPDPPAPNLASLSVTSGPVGKPVTIAGTNFGPAQATSTVKFNGTAAKPTDWSATSVTAPVRSGAIAGNVTVTVGSQTSNAINPTVAASDMSVTISPVRGGGAVTKSHEWRRVVGQAPRNHIWGNDPLIS